MWRCARQRHQPSFGSGGRLLRSGCARGSALLRTGGSTCCKAKRPAAAAAAAVPAAHILSLQAGWVDATLTGAPSHHLSSLHTMRSAVLSHILLSCTPCRPGALPPAPVLQPGGRLPNCSLPLHLPVRVLGQAQPVPWIHAAYQRAHPSGAASRTVRGGSGHLPRGPVLLRSGLLHKPVLCVSGRPQAQRAQGQVVE